MSLGPEKNFCSATAENLLSFSRLLAVGVRLSCGNLNNGFLNDNDFRHKPPN